MLTFTKDCQGELLFSFPCPKEQLLFFDIETTGFSPKTSALYLIGALYYKEGHWNIIQWFADDYKSEKEILVSFFTFLTSYTHLIHFNGNQFDIPFLLKKCQQHELCSSPYNFDGVESIDLFKAIHPYKKRLAIENLKQKTVEHFLHIQREDTYSGKELISFYQNYLKAKKEQDEADAAQLEHFLLLHNSDDLEGMLALCDILFLKDILDGNLSFLNLSGTCQEDCIEISGTLPFTLSFPIHGQDEIFSLSIRENTFYLSGFLYKGELKYFYENYKDYYYLPKEDTAIHKSVATYVDKSYRQKATRKNCYTKKEGLFLPSFSDKITPYFRTDFENKNRYILPEETILQDPAQMQEYINSFLRENKTFVFCSSDK